MSTNATLKAEKRDGRGKGAARKMRADGRVPGVVYGGDDESLAVSVDARDAEHLFRSISVENTIVALDVKGVKGTVQTLVREVQVHPYRPELVHVDFFRITEGQKLEVEIPVHLNGTAVGVKDSGGVVQQVIHELPVYCLPSKIPESFEIDISHLDIGDSIHVSDIALDEDFEVMIEPERTICTVVLPRQEVEEEEEEEAEVELIGEDGEPIEAEAEGEGEGGEGDEGESDSDDE